VIRKAIEASGITETQDPVKFNALMQAASLAVGSVGGASGASSAWAGDVYNRQLHPIEKKVISEEIAERYARDHDVTVEQAQRTLEAQLLRMVDANAAVQGGWDQEATNYLKGYAHRVGTYSIGNDQWGNSVPLFGASAGYQRQDSTIFSAHPQTSVPPPKLGLGAAAGYFEGVATGISGTVSDTINAIAHPLDTAGKVWDSVSALFTDPVGTGQAMQESVRPMADAAQQGNLKPAGEQIGQQAVGTAIGLAAGLTGKWVSGKWIPGDSVVDAGIRWGKGVQGQGMPWEDYLAKQLPAGSRLPANFPTFDFYDLGSKTAISAKTLDTTTPSKIANPKQVFSSLKGNIDTAANFGSAKKGVISLERNDIISYQLRVAVPEKTTFEQWKQIEKAIEYGRQRGVAVRITKVR
jgi:filamentous hemagglutinin